MSTEVSCPKCGKPRGRETTECPFCGIVFARYDHHRATRQTAPPVPATSTPPRVQPPPAHPPAGAATTVSPPPAGTPRRAGAGVWREGEEIVLLPHASLPLRCMRCNRATAETIYKKLYWHPRALSLLLVLPILYVGLVLVGRALKLDTALYWDPRALFVLLLVPLYVVLVLLMRKVRDLDLPLCPEHQRRRLHHTLGAVGVLMVSLIVIAKGIGDASSVWIGAGFVVLMGGLIYLKTAYRVAYAVMIGDQGGARLRGAWKPYMNALPRAGHAPINGPV